MDPNTEKVLNPPQKESPDTSREGTAGSIGHGIHHGRTKPMDPSPGNAADPAQIAKLFEETPEWPACVGGTEGTVWGGTGSDGPKMWIWVCLKIVYP